MDSVHFNHREDLDDKLKSLLLIQDRPDKSTVIAAPHHAPGGTKQLPCPEHTASDENTGLIAHLFADLIQVSSIIACNSKVDPNKSLDSEYSQTILSWAPKYLIEIHGHGGKRVSGDIIEVSSGSLSKNESSTKFAEILQTNLKQTESLGNYQVSGDFSNLHFKATNSSTITHKGWTSFHIELPPSLRLDSSDKLPATIEEFLAALRETVKIICI